MDEEQGRKVVTGGMGTSKIEESLHSIDRLNLVQHLSPKTDSLSSCSTAAGDTISTAGESSTSEIYPEVAASSTEDALSVERIERDDELFERHDQTLANTVSQLQMLSEQISQVASEMESVSKNVQSSNPHVESTIAVISALLLQAQTKFAELMSRNAVVTRGFFGSFESLPSAHLNSSQALLLSQRSGSSELNLNERQQLHNLVDHLRVEMAGLRQQTATPKSTYQLENKVSNLEVELGRAKSALQALTTDRKRLKGEKIELLNQLKQLYGTLEEKETELRGFIRSFEQKMREADRNIRQLIEEREDSELEKWELAKQVEASNQRVLNLRKEIEHRHSEYGKLKGELFKMKSQLGAQVGSLLDVNLSSQKELEDKENDPPHQSTQQTSSPEWNQVHGNENLENEQHNCGGEICLSSESLSVSPTSAGPLQSGSSLAIGSNARAGRLSACQVSNSMEELCSHASESNISSLHHRKSSSFVIHKKLSSSKRKATATSHPSIVQRDGQDLESKTCEAERLLKEAHALKMEEWRACHVAAWLQHVLECRTVSHAVHNIKSGRILAKMSLTELNSVLGVKSPLHRRKLQLALLDKTSGGESVYPLVGQLSHLWVSQKWLCQLGLSQYSSSFAEQLVDGRVLNTLGRKDLERHLGMTRRFHQASLMCGLHFLRQQNFNVESILRRRRACQKENVDVSSWDNKRLELWLRQIDLKEYLSNFSQSGLHGAVLTIDVSMNAEQLANVLGIPSNKTYVRRHLEDEFSVIMSGAAIGPKNADGEGFHRFGKRRSLRDSIGRMLSRRVNSSPAKNRHSFSK